MRGKFTSGAVGGAANIEALAQAIAPQFRGTSRLFQGSPDNAAAADRLLCRAGRLVRPIAGLSHVLSHVLAATASSERCAVCAAPTAGFGDLHV